MPVELKGERVPILLWAPVNEVESGALDQLKNLAALPWIFHHVAAMPDVHVGAGSTIGSVIATKGAVPPAAVGVDIGCGMMAAKLLITVNDLPDSLTEIRSAIEAAVPVGFTHHKDPAYLDLPVTARNSFEAMIKMFSALSSEIHKIQGLFNKAECQLGTLGGGNHFIELSHDEGGHLWIVLHSGSRNVGKQIADLHVNRARGLEHNRHLPDRNLSVLLEGTPEFTMFKQDFAWAQSYAQMNRRLILGLALGSLYRALGMEHKGVVDTVECHHNYMAHETHFGESVWITRKGAINAEAGNKGIVPGSMATPTYIVMGIGNPESFSSSAHGAGRRMSRGAAKRRFTIEDVEKQTKGIECRKDRGIIDELPGSYKDIESVMANQTDLVRVVTKLQQLLCIKG